MDLIALTGEPHRVLAGAAADIENVRARDHLRGQPLREPEPKQSARGRDAEPRVVVRGERIEARAGRRLRVQTDRRWATIIGNRAVRRP